ncbi:Plasmid segregation protein ParM [Klebsiella pneumoniae]|nr:Plasmid segregation protein ParM [Klebsiella pneumoniae]
MNIYCDDGSTNVKLAWFEGDELQTRVSANSFRHGWKVAEFSAATFNYQVGTLKYTGRQPGCHPDNKRGISVR